MDEKICRECGTENEGEYIYCKNCGAELNQNSNTHEKGEGEYTQNPNFAHNNTGYGGFSHESEPVADVPTGNPYCVIDSIDGVPMEEISIFVGKNAHKICPEFEKMEIKNSKISWCWPAAILGIFMGPFGASLWFFYRKMHKVALIFAAIGILISTATSLTSSDAVTNYIHKFINSKNTETFFEDIDNFSGNKEETPEATVSSKLSSLLNKASNLATAVIAGLFGYYWYKKKVVESVKYYKSTALDTRYYKIGLSAAGGTSGGMLALGFGIIIAYGTVSSIIQLALTALG